MKSLPPLQKPHKATVPDSPEAMFQSLSTRAKSHGYLRGPQQDALRAYKNEAPNQDVALELPTGAGKTSVGLLIAEWQRRSRRARTAYVTLTNQLAAQVIEEAKALTIPVADLRGSKDQRNPVEVGRFQDASAIAVSTYSNLFNVNPVLRECETVVFDDAHGGGDYAGQMWTLRVMRQDFPDEYAQLFSTVRPILTESQLAALSDAAVITGPTLIDFERFGAAQQEVTNILSSLPSGSSPTYAWRLLRGHMDACHFLISSDCIALRPYITPTFDHPPFADVKHRIYMSATLGDVEDLKRAYAVENVTPIRAGEKQDGKRYVFVPGLAMGDDQVVEAISTLWKDLDPKRLVGIAPSFALASRLQSTISDALPANVQFFTAKDVEDSLEPFTAAENAALLLANRYDGLDLPDDDCRLLILSESPRAVNEIEACLSSSWKLGPALRWREATRLAQGMGRCTRNATDFAVILLLGQSLVDSVTNQALLRLLPAALQRELEWGRAQIKSMANDPHGLASMMAGLIENSTYRMQADEAISELADSTLTSSTAAGESIAKQEVRFAKMLWNADYSQAHEEARGVADSLSGDDWAGYRSWWLYLASIAARSASNPSAQLEAIQRAKGIGINSGWLDHLLRRCAKPASSAPAHAEEARQAVVERVWNVIDELGWSGPKFGEFAKAMVVELMDTSQHKKFHQGLAKLGKLLGALAEAPSGQGEPDVIWKFSDRVWVCFEAKTEKLVGGSGLSKKDLLQARGHIEWTNFFKSQGKGNLEVTAVVVAKEKKVQTLAEPHKGSLHFLGTEEILAWAKEIRKGFLTLRAQFAGQDFAAVRSEFVEMLQTLQLDFAATLGQLRSDPL